MTTSTPAPTSRRTASEVDTSAFKAQTIAVIGYGSQGRAHAMNLNDSGCDVIVGVRAGGAGAQRAQADGLRTMEPGEAAKAAKMIVILTPDMSHEAVYNEYIAPNLDAGDALMFAHGFSVHFGRVKAPADVDVMLVAPKGPGDLVRREYERGRGVPCLYAVDQDATGDAQYRALAYTACIGGANSGVIETSFAEETETDLFGEQAVLCGGATELVLAGYETLVDAGYQPEVAYFECLHELKLIVDLLYEGGLSKMHEFISETAIYGDLRSGPRVINDETRARMKEVLTDIQDGTFARDWITENQAGKPQYQALLRKDLDHPIEHTGAALRADMPWLQPGSNTA
ncbi:ketol-acid reductoisomerase [Maricaulis sp. D1M11]|uniref:ketol-acid reductoisomerase n=1 Tax=Maricaulis sp. D1M11 TaxID=3076117 RepID=UPI0039B6E576